MARSFKEYRRLLQSLLPKGKFWSRAESSVFTQLLNALGDELSRVETRGEDLRLEAFNNTIDELLEEWEEDFAIPDPGFDLATTDAGRRSAIAVKKIAVGDQDKDYFIEIASTLGWTITITEYAKSLAGIMTAGGDGGLVTGDDATFYWIVNISVSNHDDGNIYQLMYEIDTRQPGHGQVLYRFYDVGFSNGFNNGFDAAPWWDGSWWPIGFNSAFSIGFANNSDYDGRRLTGGFAQGFGESFHVRLGGGFDFNAFDHAFAKPAYDAFVKGGAFTSGFDNGYDKPVTK